MLCTSLLAQQVTNQPTPVPADAPAAAPAPADPATAAPATDAAKTGKKKAPAAAAKKPRYELRTTPLVPGPALVVASNVNVRGQARLKGEVIGRVTKGQEVIVLEEITLRNSGPEEPSAWAKIMLPASINAWVNTTFIDPATKTVRPRRLNLRGGPGENYSIIGRLQRGEAVKEVQTKGDWTAIESPTNAYAFVAAQYLKQEPGAPTAPPTVAATAPPPPTETATVTEPAPIAPATTELPATTNIVAETPPATNVTTTQAEIAGAVTNEVPVTPEVEEPPQPRIVQREGVVRGTLSIQAPTKFELFSPESGRVINYLYTSSRDLDLRRYKGLRIIVTGEEGLDERWRNTPVVTIQRIQVLD
jgi:uncharacterized protein YgiM (DUF1202 family)